VFSVVLGLILVSGNFWFLASVNFCACCISGFVLFGCAVIQFSRFFFWFDLLVFSGFVLFWRFTVVLVFYGEICCSLVSC